MLDADDQRRRSYNFLRGRQRNLDGRRRKFIPLVKWSDDAIDQCYDLWQLLCASHGRERLFGHVCANRRDRQSFASYPNHHRAAIGVRKLAGQWRISAFSRRIELRMEHHQRIDYEWSKHKFDYLDRGRGWPSHTRRYSHRCERLRFSSLCASDC